MNGNQVKRVSAEDVSDQLTHVEKAWGVRLAFTIEAPRSLKTIAPFIVWLRMPHPLHQLEIPWWDDMLCVPEPNGHLDLLHIMWAMLEMADQVLVKGPEK